MSASLVYLIGESREFPKNVKTCEQVTHSIDLAILRLLVSVCPLNIRHRPTIGGVGRFVSHYSTSRMSTNLGETCQKSGGFHQQEVPEEGHLPFEGNGHRERKA